MTEPSAAETAAKEILFGSISGIAGKFVEYPFDTIKVRLQSQPSGSQAQYSSTLDCIKQTIRHDGYKGLYRGLSAPMAGAMFENAILFVSFSKASGLVKNLYGLTSDTELPTSGIMLSGAMSGAVTSFVLTPIELVKCRLQVETAYGNHCVKSNKPPQTISKLLSEIYTSKGLVGFWRGQTSTLIRESGGSCCWFSIYELTLRALRPVDSLKADNTQSDMMISGALAGIGYNTLFFPFDTVKSRMQTNASNASFSEVIREVWAHHGIRGFFKGWGITVARAAPSNALIFWVYESLSRRYI